MVAINGLLVLIIAAIVAVLLVNVRGKGMVAAAVVVAITIVSSMARFRMNHNAQFIFALSSVSFLIFLGVLLVLGKFI